MTSPIQIVRADATRLRSWTPGQLAPTLLLFLIAGGFVYGGVMGAFGGVTSDRWLQILYSAVKVPMLMPPEVTR